tara:strand:+ start:615 stop:887 length:273 start_codon:yes stop_codon:yes gene_type:complete
MGFRKGGLVMSKVPDVIRPPGYTVGLTGECAYLWALFLRNEADIEDDQLAYSQWQAMVESLQPKPHKPMPSAVHISALEDAITSYRSGVI